MKKSFQLFLGVVMATLYLARPFVAQAADEPTLIKGYATAYCQTGTMASGQETRDGVCAMAKKYIGCVIVVYQRLPDDSIGECIGMYECLDTGGTKGIKSGKVVDVWQPDLDACQDFMDRVYEDGCQGKVYIQIIEGEG